MSLARIRAIAVMASVTCALAALAAPAGAATSGVGSCRPGKWAHVGKQVLIWWRTDGRSAERDKAEAKRYAAAADGYMWPKLTRLMRRGALSDAGQQCNGGDGRPDVYLVPLPKGQDGAARTYTPELEWLKLKPCPASATYAEVDPRTAHLQTVGHELMHMIQDSYGPRPAQCLTYSWLAEGTAYWAGDYLYPADDAREHQYDIYLLHPWAELAYDQGSGNSWVFFLYLTETQKQGPALIRSVWEKTVSQPDSAKAVDAAIPGGFKERMPEYARYAWNQPPMTHSFRAWDRFTETPLKTRQEALKALPVKLNQKLALSPLDVTPLAHRYYRFSIADQKVRFVEFDNSWAAQVRNGAGVWAFIKLKNGSWRTVDWSGVGHPTLCRDRSEENAQELVVSVSNSTPAQDGPSLAVDHAPTIAGRDHCLAARPLSGGFTGSLVSPYYGYTLTWQGSARLEPSFTRRGPGQFDDTWEYYTLTSGHVAWQVSGTAGDCTWSGSGTLDLGQQPEAFQLELGVPAGSPIHYYLDIEGDQSKELPVTVTCGGQSSPFIIGYGSGEGAWAYSGTSSGPNGSWPTTDGQQVSGANSNTAQRWNWTMGFQ